MPAGSLGDAFLISIATASLDFSLGRLHGFVYVLTGRDAEPFEGPISHHDAFPLAGYEVP
jgi:hypothetical protein